MLIDAGADLDALNQAGVCGSPLHLSVSKANADITKEIIKKGENCLFYFRRSQIVCSGADVNAVSGQGYTPLLLAVSLNLEDITLALASASCQMIAK